MTMYRNLSFLRHVALTRADRRTLSDAMANWISVSAHMRTVEEQSPPEVALLWLQKMLAMELERSKPRMHVIERLHQRVNMHRKLGELAEVRAWIRRHRK